MAKRSKDNKKPRVAVPPLYGCDTIDVKIAVLLEAPGFMSNAQIAAECGLEERAIIRRRNRPNFERMYSERHPPAKEYIRRLMPRARLKLERLMEAENEAVALKVCERLLGSDLAPTHEENTESKRAEDRGVQAIAKAAEAVAAILRAGPATGKRAD